MKLVVISDTHGMHEFLTIPIGDVLITCGDFTDCGKYKQIKDFMIWFKSQKHKHKIVVPGNHEIGLCPILNPHDIGCCGKLMNGIHYLTDSGVVIDGVKFWGSPWVNGEKSIMEKWGFYDDNQTFDSVPDDVDVLITHNAPYGICDSGLGSKTLLSTVKRVLPVLHLFGHIHSGVGVYASEYTQFYNCANLDNDYRLAMAPTTIFL